MANPFSKGRGDSEVVPFWRSMADCPNNDKDAKTHPTPTRMLFMFLSFDLEKGE